MANVIPISIPPISNMLHHNNVGVIYLRTSNFRMEPIKSIPLYYVAMLESMVIVIEAPFVITPDHIFMGMKSKPQTPRETKHDNVHIEIPR